MKITITHNVDVDVDKTRLREVWPKYLTKNDVFNVEQIEQLDDKRVNIVLDNGDVLLEVPRNSFMNLPS